MPTSRLVRVALKKSVSERKLDSVAYFASWNLQNVVERTEENPLEVIWKTPDGKTAVHFIDDYLLEVKYVAVVGPDPRPVVDFLRSKVSTVSREQILAMLAKATKVPEIADALHYAAAVTTPGEFDPGLFEFFERYAAHESARVRRAVILAAGYAEWPEFEPLLRKLQDDPDPEVREEAALMLEGWKRVKRGRR